MAEKSAGLLLFESGVSDLEARIGRGEIGSQEDIFSEVLRILDEAALSMSAEELLRVRSRLLASHAVAAKILADNYGYTVPGNNPEKPN